MSLVYSVAQISDHTKQLDAITSLLAELVAHAKSSSTNEGQPENKTSMAAAEEYAEFSHKAQHKIEGHMPTASDKNIDFVIATALEEERDALLGKLPGYRRISPSAQDNIAYVYYQAEISFRFADDAPGSYQIIVLPLLGMGRVQAATATANAIQRWNPNYVLLVGIAGGIRALGVQIGDILISDQIVDYELQKITPKGPQIRYEVYRSDPRLLGASKGLLSEEWQKYIIISRPDGIQTTRHIGPIASGDKVVAFGKILDKYRDVWPKLIGVEMEASGVATAAFQAAQAPGFFMVRAVSDLADENKGATDVENLRPYACDAAAAYTVGLLKSGPVLPKSVRNLIYLNALIAADILSKLDAAGGHKGVDIGLFNLYIISKYNELSEDDRTRIFVELEHYGLIEKQTTK